MAKEDTSSKKNKFLKLYLSGKYTLKDISSLIGVSQQSLVKWHKAIPAAKYTKVRDNLAREMERLSISPSGNEELIFSYIEHINLLDTMIRKAKYTPNV